MYNLKRHVLLGLCFALTASQGALGRGLQSATALSAGRQLSGVVVGDFNNDHHQDILVIENPGSGLANTIHVLLGNGDGTFQPPKDTIAGVNLSAVVAGYFDGDQNLDIAVTDSAANTVTIFLGDGSGGFTPGTVLATGSSPVAIAAAKLTSGGLNLDLVVANAGGQNITTYLGDGAGGFSTKGSYSLGFTPTGLAVADFDHDGIADVAVSLNENRFGVFKGGGDGSMGFPSINIVPIYTNPLAIAAVDLNEDGYYDLIIATNKILYLRGDGDLTFNTAVALEAQERPSVLAIADMNNDHHQDILAGNSFAASFTVFTNNGFAGITSVNNASGSPQVVGMATGDFDEDGKIDVVTISGLPTVTLGAMNIQIAFGNGNGTMRSAFPYYFATGNSVSAANCGVIGDFNEDGLPDIAVADGVPRVTVLQNGGNYIFTPRVVSTQATDSTNLVARDLNHDGHLDLITAGFSSINVLLGNGDGTFQQLPEAPITSGFPHMVAIGDFNRDGIPDLVVTNYTNAGTIAVMFGNGDGTFQSPLPQNVMISGYLPGAVAVADFNGDGFSDIAVANSGANNVSIFMGNGSGGFIASSQYPVGNFPRGMIVATDINNDGRMDLVVGNTGNGQPGSVSVLLGNGNGTFQSAINLPLKFSAASLTVKDFDNDGIQDIAIGEGILIEIFKGHGDGTFAPATQLAAGGRAFVLDAADLNGGGVNDLAAFADDVTILPNTGGTHISTSSSPNPSVFGQNVAFHATLLPSVPGMPPVTGTVHFKQPLLDISSSIPSSGKVVFTLPILSVGTNSISGMYGGDGNYFARTFNAFSQVVNRGITTTTVSAASSSMVKGQPLQLIITVTSPTSVRASSGSTAIGPTGIVTVSEAATNFTSQNALSDGVATFRVSGLEVGTHIFNVSYSGDANFGPSSLVRVESVLDFTLSVPRSSRPSRGNNIHGAKSAAVEVTGIGQVHLSCGTLPAGLSCDFNSQDFSLNGSRLIAVTLLRTSASPTPVKRLNKASLAPKNAEVDVTATLGSLQRTISVLIPLP